MARAFVLIETALGKTKEVLATIGGTSGIESVNCVTGPYDIIAIVDMETLSDIGDIVVKKIHAMKGITRAVTCIAV